MKRKAQKWFDLPSSVLDSMRFGDLVRFGDLGENKIVLHTVQGGKGVQCNFVLYNIGLHCIDKEVHCFALHYIALHCISIDRH